ncbi:MAG: YifB family Mg chelatase-like AAA ATPase, partial [Caulobacterales bacterium]
EARSVEAQVQLSDAGQSIFNIVGLPDKAVRESQERVRAAFAALGLAMPFGRTIVNLAPADLPKQGSHFDLPIALGIMAAIGAIPRDALDGCAAMGELSLDGRLAQTPGALPAAVAANAEGLTLICPAACGAEAAWSGGRVLAAPSLIALVNHFKGRQVLTDPKPGELAGAPAYPDMRDVKGQERAKRAVEIAAAGGHNLLMVGPAGSGKSMLASRLPGLLPPLDAAELLEISMIHSVAGLLERGALTRARPYRAPHHSASMAALVGGGLLAKPGEASLAHRGVLFLDELPEFSSQALDSLRQPLETGEVMIARANGHVRYPARFQLIAAMNPCRCGAAPGECVRGPRCSAEYQSRVSGPLLDRMDLSVEVLRVSAADLAAPPSSEGTAEIAARVFAARHRQKQRYAQMSANIATNCEAEGAVLEAAVALDDDGGKLLVQASEKLRLSARGYHRVLKVARTIADLTGEARVRRAHLAEALSYRREPQDFMAANAGHMRAVRSDASITDWPMRSGVSDNDTSPEWLS